MQNSLEPEIAMMAKQAMGDLDAFVKGLVVPLGFNRKESLWYTRLVNEATGSLSFPFRIDSQGLGSFTVGVGLEFEALARALGEDVSDIVACIGSPIHFLREDRSYTEWKFSTKTDLEVMSAEINQDLKKYAIPFIERYSSLSALQKTLESSNPKDWFSLGADRRVIVLAVIQFLHGDKAGALRIMDQALLERKDALPKRRFEIEYVRKRIAGQGPGDSLAKTGCC
jgi:hypothetical protein